MDREWLNIFADPAGTDASVLLVVAHPDDETVGAGGILPRFRRTSLLCVTDGSPPSLDDAQHAGCKNRGEYAALRADELRGAASLAGISPERITMLGIADQQASLQILEIAHQLVRRVQRLRPDLLVTHAYEGGHPDHDATALAVYVMQRLLESKGGHAPDVIEMASYHGARGGLTANQFLPRTAGPALTIALSPDQQSFKQQMVSCHASQQHVLNQFGTQREAFRAVPAYDFSQSPHAGRLWYERFDWGMTGPHWRRLATAALRELSPCVGGL